MRSRSRNSNSDHPRWIYAQIPLISEEKKTYCIWEPGKCSKVIDCHTVTNLVILFQGQVEVCYCLEHPEFWSLMGNHILCCSGVSFILQYYSQFCGSIARTPSRTPGIVKGNNPLSLVLFKWGSPWWGILKHFPQSRCILISHWSREKKQSSFII